MTEQEQFDPAFFDRADAMIQVANGQCDKFDASEVGASFMFAVSRFHAFLVASGCPSKEAMATERESALGFFLEQFRSMLEDNFDEYLDNFEEYKQSTDEDVEG